MQRTAPGVVETLATGFTLINRRFWVVAIVVVLDLFLWLGPKVSISPLLEDGLTRYHHWLAESSLQFGPQQGLKPGQIEQIYAQTSQALEPLRRVNLLTALAWNLPCLIKLTAFSEMVPLGGKVMALDVWSCFFILVTGLGAIGLLGSCLYLGLIAYLVRGENFKGQIFLPMLGRGWLRLLLYFALLLVLTLMLVPLFLLVSGPATGLNPVGAGLIAVIALAVTLWFMLTLFFVDDAIFVSEVGVWKAIWYSTNIVWRHFWSAFGFFLIVNVILLGMPLAWGLMLGHPVGVVVAILGNAYIATGMATASMLYYRERYVQWHGPATQTRTG